MPAILTPPVPPPDTIKTAKARIVFRRIIVDRCPYCFRTHYHNLPVGEGIRMADCFRGEYLLDFDTDEKPKEG